MGKSAKVTKVSKRVKSPSDQHVCALRQVLTLALYCPCRVADARVLLVRAQAGKQQQEGRNAALKEGRRAERTKVQARCANS